MPDSFQNAFPGHYTPSEERLKELWKEAIFVFDTNFLLDIFRRSPEAIEEVFKALDSLNGRYWLPYQVVVEYHNRINEIANAQNGAFFNKKSEIEKKLKELTECFNKILPVEADITTAKESLEKFADAIRALEKPEMKRNEIDSLKIIISDYFKGKWGEPFGENERKTIEEKAKKRFSEEIPPGYKDNKKTTNAYGDFYLWHQILEKAKKDNHPVIFVTRDQKEDWWRIVKGKTLGPREELINEFVRETGHSFYMYSTERFFEFIMDSNESVSLNQVIHEIRIDKEDADIFKVPFAAFARSSWDIVAYDAIMLYLFHVEWDKRNSVVFLPQIYDITKLDNWKRKRIFRMVTSLGQLRDALWDFGMQSVEREFHPNVMETCEAPSFKEPIDAALLHYRKEIESIGWALD